MDKLENWTEKNSSQCEKIKLEIARAQESYLKNKKNLKNEYKYLHEANKSQKPK